MNGRAEKVKQTFELGCQTITFGERQRERFPELLASVAAAGYDGVEIGFRHIRDLPAVRLRDLLEQNGLQLLATHVGGDLNDLQGAQGERRLFHEVVDYLEVTGTKSMMYSGLTNKNPEQFARDLALLRQAARACASRGIRLLYHNHDWEFADGGGVMEGILGLDGPTVGLCVDVGWVMKGRQNAVAFLERVRDRIEAIHFKDFATGPSSPRVVDTVVLGRGVAPLAETAAWLKANQRNLWVVAEQDHTDGTPEAAVAANARYLKDLFDEKEAGA